MAALQRLRSAADATPAPQPSTLAVVQVGVAEEARGLPTRRREILDHQNALASASAASDAGAGEDDDGDDEHGDAASHEDADETDALATFEDVVGDDGDAKGSAAIAYEIQRAEEPAS